MKHLVQITVLLTLMLSCNKVKPEKLEGEKSFLVGNWNRTHTKHTFGWCDNESHTETLNEMTEESSYSIRFETEGLVHFYENEVLLETNKIVFDYFKVNNDSSISLVILLNNDENKKMSGYGNESNMNFGKFPYVGVEGCEDYDNYFAH